ncbi:MAG: cysteine synthase A, partial [Planctomycetaceae bacterium]
MREADVYWGAKCFNLITEGLRAKRQSSVEAVPDLSEPELASLILSGKMQKNNEDGSTAESHPNWTPHPIQGWTPDFIPKLTAETIASHYIDTVLTVSGAAAIKCSKQLATQEGIFVGISAGATLATAI